MQFSRSSATSLRCHSQWMGVVLLLLVYMAQPVLAISSTQCGCFGMVEGHACSCSQGGEDVDAVATMASCCAQKAPMVKRSCCADSQAPANTAGDADSDAGGHLEAHSVCQCQHNPVDSAPDGVIFDGQTFEGPFAWWAVLESHACESRCLAPHLGGLEHLERTSIRMRPCWPPGWVGHSDWGPTGPAVSRLRTGGLIAFLADLSEANL